MAPQVESFGRLSIRRVTSNRFGAIAGNSGESCSPEISANFGPLEELLTDNGPQYVTWRSRGQITRPLEKRGIKQIVANVHA